MSFKSQKYSSKEEENDLEALSERLAVDLRKSIRQLSSCPLFSEAWLEMADVFGRIAKISDMESNLPAPKQDATLWETEEQALRFLLEDGKLNLCLRNMIEFKQQQRATLGGPAMELAAECDKFEKGLGTVLKNAWSHIEAIQTTDLYALINHIADTVESSLANPVTMKVYIKNGDFHQRQEILVLHYLSDLLRLLEGVGEDRIMPLVRERRLFTTTIRFLNIYHTDVMTVHVVRAVEALGHLVESEDFAAFRDSYVSDQSDAELLMEFKESCLATLSADVANRKAIRPLIDCCDKAKRKFRLK